MERVVRTAVGVKIVQLVTDDPDAARCPACATVSTSGKDWVLTRPRDLPCGGRVRGGAVAQAALAVPHRGLCRGRRSPSRSPRCRPGCAPRLGCGRRWRWRWRTAGTSPRSLLRIGCRGRRCSGRSSCTARSSWSSRSRRRCWGWTRPGSGGRGGCPTGDARGRPDPVAAHGSVGDRVRRHHRRAGPVGAGRRPDQRRGAGLAGRPHARRSGPGSRWW